MKKDKYFYFSDPHSFKYPLLVDLMFKKENGYLMHRSDRSKWIEVENYTYYGEPVNCIIPAHNMEYDFVFNLLNSEKRDNIWGAINYMLCNYRERFLLQVKSNKCPSSAVNIIRQYFRKDIQI